MGRKETVKQQVKKLASKVNKLDAQTERNLSIRRITNASTTNGTSLAVRLTDQMVRDSNTATTISRFHGNEVSPTFLHVKGFVQTVAAQAGKSAARFIVIQSKQRFNPDTSDIDINDATNVLNTNQVADDATMFSDYNFYNRGHFTVLKDVTFKFGNGDTDATPTCHTFDWKIPIKRKIKWDEDSNLESGHIYLCPYSNQTTNAPTYDAVSTLYYKDA